MRRRETYTTLQIVLHWAVVVLIIAAWFLHDQMRGYDKLPLDAALPLHGKLGLAVFFLMILRLVVRLWAGAPPPPENDPPLQRSIAKWTHRAIYALAIFGPWAGGFAFYMRLDIAGELHEILINLLVIASFAHVAAALYHQVYLKDGLMNRMRPKRRT